MVKAAMSDTFSYDSADIILSCDAAGLTSSDGAGIGWVIYDAKTLAIQAEGRLYKDNIKSTSEAECQAVAIGLTEVAVYGCTSVIVHTDFEGIPQHFAQSSNVSLNEAHCIEQQLTDFESWCFNNIHRDSLQRAHDIAQSAYRTTDNE